MNGLGKIFFGFIMGCVAMFFIERGFKHKNAERAAKVAAKEQTAEIAAIHQHMNDTVTHTTDANGIDHAEKTLIQGDAAAVKIFYKKQMDSLCDVLKIRDNQVSGMYTSLSNVSGTFTTSVDHVGLNTPDGPGEVRHFVYADSFLEEEGWVDSARADVSYTMRVPVHITTFWTRRWFLGKKHYFVDGYCDNPNAVITGLTAVQINSKK
jgi:hypothetical protein